MRALDRLTKQQQKKNMDKERRRRDFTPDEDVELEMEFPRVQAINLRKSAFDEGAEKRFGGINTAPSVFDRKAVFHVSPPDGGGETL